MREDLQEVNEERLRWDDAKESINLLRLQALEQRPDLVRRGKTFTDTPVSDGTPSAPGFAPYGVSLLLR